MVSLIAQYFKFSVAMKSQLGIFLNAPESTKTLCFIFQALDIANTLVKPSAENRWMFGSVSAARGCSSSHPRLLLLRRPPRRGKRPQLSVPSEVLRFAPTALILLEKCPPLATTSTAEGHQEPIGSTAAQVPFQGCAGPRDSFLGCHTTHRAAGSPPSYSAAGDQATIRTHHRK